MVVLGFRQGIKGRVPGHPQDFVPEMGSGDGLGLPTDQMRNARASTELSARSCRDNPRHSIGHFCFRTKRGCFVPAAEQAGIDAGAAGESRYRNDLQTGLFGSQTHWPRCDPS